MSTATRSYHYPQRSGFASLYTPQSKILLTLGFTYVLSSRLSQDPLVLFLGLIIMLPVVTIILQRWCSCNFTDYCGGETNDVTLPLPSPTGSTQTTRCKTIEFALECIESLATFSADDDAHIDLADVPEPSFRSVKDNIVYYITWFVVRQRKKVITCEKCLGQLTTSQNTKPQAALINWKLWGAHQWPSEILFHCLGDVEETVCKYTNDKLTPSMFTNIFEDCLQALLPLKAKLFSDHGALFASEIIVYYISKG